MCPWCIIVCFQMPFQIVFPRRYKVTFVAFIWLFFTVRFQMCPQIVCPRRCKVTLVAFVWLFFTVRFQMCPQSVCPRRSKVTLVAFVWLFSSVCFQMCPQMACLGRCIASWLHLYDFSPLCIFKCSRKLLLWVNEKSHWVQLFDLFSLLISLIGAFPSVDVPLIEWYCPGSWCITTRIKCYLWRI